MNPLQTILENPISQLHIQALGTIIHPLEATNHSILPLLLHCILKFPIPDLIFTESHHTMTKDLAGKTLTLKKDIIQIILPFILHTTNHQILVFLSLPTNCTVLTPKAGPTLPSIWAPHTSGPTCYLYSPCPTTTYQPTVMSQKLTTRETPRHLLLPLDAPNKNFLHLVSQTCPVVISRRHPHQLATVHLLTPRWLLYVSTKTLTPRTTKRMRCHR